MQPQSLVELNTTKYKGLPVTFVRFCLGTRSSSSTSSSSAAPKRRPSRLGLSLATAAASGNFESLTPMAATSSTLIGQHGDATWGFEPGSKEEGATLTMPDSRAEASSSSADATAGEAAAETILQLALFVAKNTSASGNEGERLVGTASVACSSLVIGQSAKVVFGKPKKKGFEARAAFHFTVNYDNTADDAMEQQVALLNDGLLDGAELEAPDEPKKLLYREPFLEHALTCLSRCQLELAEMAPEVARHQLDEVLSTFDTEEEVESENGALSFASLLELFASLKTGTGGIVMLQVMDEATDDSGALLATPETSRFARLGDVAVAAAVGIAAIGRDGFDEREEGRSNRQGTDKKSQREQQQQPARVDDSSDSGAFGLGFGGEVASGIAAHLAWGKDFTESNQQLQQQSGEAPTARHDSLFSLTQGMAAGVFLALWHKGAFPGEEEAAEGLTIAAKRRVTVQWGESMGRHPVYDILFDDGELKTHQCTNVLPSFYFLNTCFCEVTVLFFSSYYLSGETEHRRRCLRFRDFRELYDKLGLLEPISSPTPPLPENALVDPSQVAPPAAEFPKTYTKSFFGRTLTAVQLSKRFTMLAAWLEALDLNVEQLDPTQRQTYEDFLYGPDGDVNDD